MPNYTITLTAEHLQFIINCVTKAPWELANPVVLDLRKQIDGQQSNVVAMKSDAAD